MDVDQAPLFADWQRQDASKADDEETTWSFLDRVADPALARVRCCLNEWFERYPREHRKGLRGRLASGDNVEFHGAWFELYLHELHRRLGFSLEVEPDLPGVPTHPDFLLERHGEQFFLEATVIGDRDGAGRARRIDRIVSSLNRIENPDFGLFFDIEAEGNDSPPMREVRKRVTRWLADLDWAEERAKQAASFNFETMQLHTESVGAWDFSFRAWPRRPEVRGQRDPAILAGPSDGAAFDHPQTLLDRLTNKADKYGDPPHPVIIAVRIDRLSADSEDMATALMGPTIGYVDPAKPAGPTLPGGRGTGLFRHESGRWRNQHIAGVLAWDIELRPWSVTRQLPILWLHPEPLAQIRSSLPWPVAELDATVDPEFAPGRFDPVQTFELPGTAELEDPREWPGRFEFGSRG